MFASNERLRTTASASESADVKGASTGTTQPEEWLGMVQHDNKDGMMSRFLTWFAKMVNLDPGARAFTQRVRPLSLHNGFIIQTTLVQSNDDTVC